ncbi:MAG: tRNA (adenosine(37)-N6)-threonylcarbamoyltransferase complex transferase subunit TsaD [Candidatus Magasanikbacteria bacterium RIFCSPHIGHO2_02_FULL_48_18]|nr:MAG: tRNA (adenosine(37)-N6)-threonylcarbamoyltransferase complex transferase subunit TsaD [Candidatus Magasanikbacteria bacterium RIFCSPLOWO2_02_FULL_47_16]OGH80197.1 MAG: tRNA (adenosine(37)-N6)-threonylcarbamoyltransferase complex transferase subunit TsaD [Candidatus Magasanikbacteria bacterium RIFCSPHIGHO2_02_FULL_48_18]
MMRILGIESSCDDTSAALVEWTNAGQAILSQKTASQIDIHKKYGGVVPEIAGRKHAEAIIPVLEEVLSGQKKPDAIAVTSGPGLIAGLLVGVEVAKTLSALWDIPIVSVNHIDGHVHSVELGQTSHIEFPAIALVVSGGHTELLLAHTHNCYTLIGKTQDDAAGEAFDKVAKLLGLEYPGGPKISQFAKTGNPNKIPFPRPMIHDEGFDLSFSGLKTAALYWLRDHTLSAGRILSIGLPSGVTGIQAEEPTIHDFCASFEQAIVDVLVLKTMRAVEAHKPNIVILAGGVAANIKLRQTLGALVQTQNAELRTPLIPYCMDNAGMIATAGYYKAEQKTYTPWRELTADPNWRVYDAAKTRYTQ